VCRRHKFSLFLSLSPTLPSADSRAPCRRESGQSCGARTALLLCSNTRAINHAATDDEANLSHPDHHYFSRYADCMALGCRIQFVAFATLVIEFIVVMRVMRLATCDIRSASWNMPRVTCNVRRAMRGDVV
jgi:hypothetical protein